MGDQDLKCCSVSRYSLRRHWISVCGDGIEKGPSAVGHVHNVQSLRRTDGAVGHHLVTSRDQIHVFYVSASVKGVK